jgi:hypothetical protein
MNTAADPYERTEVRDGMRITWHQRITAQDGLVLRADVYRPIEDIQCRSSLRTVFMRRA